jgi:MFS family permease
VTDTPTNTDSAETEVTSNKKPKPIPLGINYWKLWSASVVSNLGDGVAAIAYPWLASAVTRDPLLIALIAVAQRLPWLIFTLPAGVITDRLDRKKIMTSTAIFRTVLTAGVAAVVVLAADSLPDPGDIVGSVEVATNVPVYLTLVLASLAFGFAEVLFDNSAQTILPAIVEPEGLERANGRLWGAEMVMNSFVGPPLGSLLIGVAFALPFFFDMGTFAISAVFIFAIAGTFSAGGVDGPAPQAERAGFVAEIKEGVSWLWKHPLLRPMAIILGLMNGLGAVTMATFILFAQEVLVIDATTFAFLGMAGAVGGVIGSLAAPRIAEKLGSGPSLYITLIGGSLTTILIGLASNWIFVAFMFASFTVMAVLWNVITVSLRQTIIPDELLGRVNSVYRFFAWGMMPIGLGVGGLMVAVADAAGLDRVMALRIPYFFSGAVLFLVFLWAAPRLTTAKIETARAEGVEQRKARQQAKESSDDVRQPEGDSTTQS